MGKAWWSVVVVVCVVAVGVAEGQQVNRCFKEEGPARLSPHFPRNVENFGLRLFRDVSQVSTVTYNGITYLILLAASLSVLYSYNYILLAK